MSDIPFELRFARQGDDCDIPDQLMFEIDSDKRLDSEHNIRLLLHLMHRADLECQDGVDGYRNEWIDDMRDMIDRSQSGHGDTQITELWQAARGRYQRPLN